MTTAELESVEQQVLGWVRKANGPVSTTTLLERHQGEIAGLSGETLRRAVWNLVDQGLLSYDHSWRVSAVPRSGR